MSSWFKKPVNIVITVGAALLTVTVIVLLIWGITHHHEGGLLEVCWVDGEARYVEGSESDHGACEGSQELRWPRKQIPITIQNVEEEAPARVLAKAAADLNSQVGFELFRMVAHGQPADASVHIRAFEVQNTPPPGYVVHRRSDERMWGEVHIRSDVASVDRTLYLVAEHEYLHLAGLEHDDFTLSLMFPVTHEDWASENMSTAHVTDNDKALLRELYHL
jgi:hypothetical protein